MGSLFYHKNDLKNMLDTNKSFILLDVRTEMEVLVSKIQFILSLLPASLTQISRFNHLEKRVVSLASVWPTSRIHGKS